MYRINYSAHIFIDSELELDNPMMLSELYISRKQYIASIETLLKEKYEELHIPDFETEVEDDCLVTHLPYSYNFIKTGTIEVGIVNSDIEHTIEDYIKRKFGYPEDCLMFIEWELTV